MKRIFLMLGMSLLASQCFATDVTYDDKVTGGTFSAAEANNVKNAVNSKANISAITWITATAYTANNQSVTHGGHVFVCTSNHTAGASTEPGVGASWATVWRYHGVDLYEPLKGEDDNYVTDAEKARLGNLELTDNVTFGNVTAAGGALYAGVANTTQGALVLYTNTDPIYTAGFTPAATPSGSVTIKFPPAPPTGANYLWNVDVNGTSDWTDPASFEPALGNPAVTGYVLASTDAGVRSWVEMTGGSAEVQDEAFSAANFDTDTTHAVSQDDFYDRFHLFDADDDGDFTDETWFPSTSGAPTNATYLTTSNETGLSAEANLGALTTGILKIAVAVGVATPSTAVAGDFPTLNQNTTGTAAGLSGTPNITVGTVSAGAGGFIVDADGDATAKSFSTTFVDGAMYSELPINTAANPYVPGVSAKLIKIFNNDGVPKLSISDAVYTMLTSNDIDDTPSDGNTTQPASSNSVKDLETGLKAKYVSGTEADFYGTLLDPQAIYAVDATNHAVTLINDVPAAFTITEISVSCDADPTTETTFTFQHKVVGVGYGSPTTIEAVLTVNGTATITSGIDDATIPAGTKVFMTLSDPDDALNECSWQIEGDWD